VSIRDVRGGRGVRGVSIRDVRGGRGVRDDGNDHQYRVFKTIGRVT